MSQPCDHDHMILIIIQKEKRKKNEDQFYKNKILNGEIKKKLKKIKVNLC